MGSQGRIPGPRARLHDEGMKKSQRLIDLRLQGDRGRQRALAWGSRHVIARHRTGNRHCWYHVTPRAFVSSRGEIKGSAQATSWGLWSGKDEPCLIKTRDAGLLEMARSRMLALAVNPSPPASGLGLRAGKAGRRAACQARLNSSSLESMKN